MALPRVVIAIRSAAAADAAGIARLLGELGYPAPADEIPLRLQRIVADGRAAVVVAANGDEIIGLCTVHLRTSITSHADIAQITSMVVSELARGRGAGRLLVEEAESWARRHGVVRMVVTTALHRAGAHAFYERLGYEHTGRRYAREIS